MRWRSTKDLGYATTHPFELKNTRGGTVYHMIFATDSEAGTRIMADLYAKTAKLVPAMRQEARDRAKGQGTLDLGDVAFDAAGSDSNHRGSRRLRALHEVAIQICS